MNRRIPADGSPVLLDVSFPPPPPPPPPLLLLLLLLLFVIVAVVFFLFPSLNFFSFFHSYFNCIDIRIGWIGIVGQRQDVSVERCHGNAIRWKALGGGGGGERGGACNDQWLLL